ALALFGGRWLAQLAGKAPANVEWSLAREGRFVRRHSTTQAEVQAESGLGRWLSRLTRAAVWIAALVAISLNWLADQTLVPVIDVNHFGREIGALALRVGGSLLALACTLGIAPILHRSLVVSMERRVNRNLSLLSGRILYIATLAVGLIVVLAIWGAGIVLPVALIGALTVALSLALQDVLKNLVSGVYILLERPFTIGDRITLLPYTGEVEDIEIRYTALRTADGQRVIIPNAILFGSAVVNLSAYERHRSSFTVTVPDTGPGAVEHAEAQIRAALNELPEVLDKPVPEVIVTRAAKTSIDLQVVYWLPSEGLDRRAAIFSQVLEQVRARVE